MTLFWKLEAEVLLFCKVTAKSLNVNLVLCYSLLWLEINVKSKSVESIWADVTEQPSIMED